jgi:hypothetical protein
MNGLATYNVVMVSLLALVSAGVLGAFLGAVLWELFGDLVLAAGWAARTAVRPVGRRAHRAGTWVGRASRGIVEGFKDGVEWLLYV